MLERIHDSEIQMAFKRDMLHITIEEAEDFCRRSSNTDRFIGIYDRHWAIANEQDEYLGIISLKNISIKEI